MYSFPKGTELLAGGKASGEETKRRIVRGCLELDFEGGFTVATTHLDHIDEAERLTQSRALAQILRGKRAVLAGDLNALTRDDYGDVAWAALSKRAKERGWAFGASDAEGGCLWHLKKGCRFVDLWQVSSSSSSPPSSSSPSSPPSSLSSPSLLSSSSAASAASEGGHGSRKFLTAHGLYRIDYLMASPQLASISRVPRAFVADAQAWGLDGVSDHSPVVVDLELDEAEALSSKL